MPGAFGPRGLPFCFSIVRSVFIIAFYIATDGWPGSPLGTTFDTDRGNGVSWHQMRKCERWGMMACPYAMGPFFSSLGY